MCCLTIKALDDDDCIDFDLRTTEQRRDAGRADRRQRAIGVLAAAQSKYLSTVLPWKARR